MCPGDILVQAAMEDANGTADRYGPVHDGPVPALLDQLARDRIAGGIIGRRAHPEALLHDLASLAVIKGGPHQPFSEIRGRRQKHEGPYPLRPRQGGQKRHPPSHGRPDQHEGSICQTVDDGKGVAAPAAYGSFAESAAAFAVAEIVKAYKTASRGGGGGMKPAGFLAQHVGVKAAQPDQAASTGVSGGPAIGDVYAFMIKIIGRVGFHGVSLIGLRRYEKALWDSHADSRDKGRIALALKGATILQVIPHLGAGGAERTTLEVAEALAAAGARALVASCGGRLEAELSRAGGELIRIDALSTKNPMQVWLNAGVLARVIAERGVRLVHARSRAPGWSAYWAARRLRLPFVTTYHGVYDARSPLKRWYNSVMARGDRVIANSEYTAAHVRAQHPEAAGRIVTIHRGVDIARFTPEAVSPARQAALRRAWELEEGEGPVILLPGRLTGWKGQREAIEAAGRLANDGPATWRMVLAGDHQGRLAYQRELTELIASLRLEQRVRLAGHCDDMPAALRLSDIVIAPSNEPEAFGRVAAEAGAMGVPAVGTSLGAQSEIIEHGKTGLIIPPGDPEALAGAIRRLLSTSPAGRRQIGTRARERICQLFTTAALQKATLAVYEGLMDKPA